MNPETVIEWGAASIPQPGQVVSGDQFVVAPTENGVLVAVVDGLGHGEQAAEAANVAVETLRTHASDPVLALVQRCHTALARTRGVVMTVASLKVEEHCMTWLGVGNVEGVLNRAAPGTGRESALLRGGVVGYQLPPLRASVLTIARGDVLVLATDGIRGAFADALPVSGTPQQMADGILARFGRGTDDALVFVARYAGGIS